MEEKMNFVKILAELKEAGLANTPEGAANARVAAILEMIANDGVGPMTEPVEFINRLESEIDRIETEADHEVDLDTEEQTVLALLTQIAYRLRKHTLQEPKISPEDITEQEDVVRFLESEVKKPSFRARPILEQLSRLDMLDYETYKLRKMRRWYQA